MHCPTSLHAPTAAQPWGHTPPHHPACPPFAAANPGNESYTPLFVLFSLKEQLSLTLLFANLQVAESPEEGVGFTGGRKQSVIFAISFYEIRQLLLIIIFKCTKMELPGMCTPSADNFASPVYRTEAG